jgi:hypothetical protein
MKNLQRKVFFKFGSGECSDDARAESITGDYRLIIEKTQTQREAKNENNSLEQFSKVLSATTGTARRTAADDQSACDAAVRGLVAWWKSTENLPPPTQELRVLS